ncbi:hypothetical protein FEK33_26990 [Nocardia asteroides NBRC 15531]|uniref:DUF732 domain-containing protein n=1 Tax=Nocardia asteroides NBRC 15531 TaxID=1110697 RepID=U5EQL6_NOCAS|nr:hypothetical protein [Nocardia asteroides]TLF63637.1 hypothetical protein FEK33_26990 [Nocardia asteroides NBRC 15531]UGT46903.1 hypothetical protein LT345_20515 [Nocardia asteroides]GAD87399.1 hypothetical protein NCAST_34_05280 [Nocardia asteroides NBRC 15531]
MTRGGAGFGLFVVVAGAVLAAAGCSGTEQGTATPASSAAAASTTKPGTSTAPVPAGDLTTMTCAQFLALDDPTQKSTLVALADQLGYQTKVNPGNYKIVQAMCKADGTKLVKDWLGRA